MNWLTWLTLLWVLLHSAGTQLPHVHDFTWFDDSEKERPPAWQQPRSQGSSGEAVLDKHTLTVMQSMTAACHQNPTCLKLGPFERVACVRRCVSPGCYAKVYSQQPLEPGEIDVLYPDYKRCFHRVWKHKYRSSLNVQRDPASGNASS